MAAMQRTQINLPEALISKLDAEAKQKGVSRAEVIRQAVWDHINTPGSGEKGSKKMKVVQVDHAWRIPPRISYETDITDIVEAASKFGRTEDTVELWEGDTLVALATWPQWSRAYKYCKSPESAHIPQAWRYAD
jgi:hypothetical protein